MSSLSVRLKPETLRTSAAVGAAYALLGTKFAFPIKILFIENLTDGTVTFSFDGVNDHLVLPKNGTFALDVSTNKSNMGTDLEIPETYGVWAKETAGMVGGSVYVTTFYAD